MDRIHAAGAELVFLGTGSAFFARGFREEFGVTGPILVDPERRSYKLLGMARGVGTAMNLAMLRNARRATAAGFRQTAVKGDPWQHGGVLIVQPDGTVPYIYRSATAGDHPPVDDVLAALEGAAA